MKLEDARESYYFYSGKTSDIVRYLGLASIGIIWMFRIESAGKTSLSRNLLLPIILLILGLSFDLLQYLTATIIWGRYHRIKELSGISKEDKFEAPRWINWAPITFFTLKIIVIIYADILLIKYLSFMLFK